MRKLYFSWRVAIVALTLITTSFYSFSQSDAAKMAIPIPTQITLPDNAPDITSIISQSLQKSVQMPACYIPHDPATWTQPDFVNLGSGGDGLDDGSSEEIALPFTVDLYGSVYSSMYININGNISFTDPYWQYSSTGFPSAEFIMIAPFWGDVDLGGVGEIWYLITPTAVYINWVGVGYYNEEVDKTNTFQLIITDGTDPVIGLGNNLAFYYDNMDWTTGAASSGVDGFGGVPATVGINAGNGVDYIQIGRFDHPGDDYDGPGGANDGVDWLDNQCIQIDASNTNIPPIAEGFPSGNELTICVGETVDLAVTFLAPELDQTATTVVSTSSTGLDVTTNTVGNPSLVIFSFTGSNSNLGANTITFVSTDDDAENPLSTTIHLTINVSNTGDCGTSGCNCPGTAEGGIDDVGPVIIGVPDDITVQCIDEVPPTTECWAYDECSGDNVTVTTFCSNTLVQDHCVLSTANGPGSDWAIWLPDLYTDGLAASPYWVFAGNGTFDSFGGGTGHAFGTLMNTADNSQMLYLNMWFENEADWAEWSGMGRWYKDDLMLATPDMLYEAWKYYELVGGFSTITGMGDWTGTALYLSHFPVDYYFGFQCGWAANNKNANFGMSGWFTYTGWVKTNADADYVSVSGNGDLNVDKTCNHLEYDCPESDNEWTCFWMATDACGNVTFESQTITVWDSTPPVIHNCPQDVYVECDELVPAALPIEELIVTDNCSTASQITYAYLGEQVQYESECYTHIIRSYVAYDCNLNRTDCFQHIYIQDTTPPQISCPADQWVQCADDVVNENATATDNCDTNVEVGYWDEVYPGDCVNQFTIFRTHWAADNCDNTSYCYQWIVVDDTTAPMFSAYNSEIWVDCDELDGVAGLEVWDNCGPVEWWTTDICLSGLCLGSIARTYHAYDLCGNYASTVLYIHVLDTTPPTIYCPAEITAECDNVPSPEELGVYAWDSCDFLCSPPFEIELNYTTSTVPGDCENSWDIYVYWSAADYCDNMGYCTTVIHVYDTTPPVFEYCPESYTIYCTDAYPSVDWAYAYDNCDEDVEISSSDNIYAGQCSGEYTIERVFRADDNCGNYTLCVQYIYVIDITPPTFEGVDEITIECDESIPYVEPTVWDDCSYPIDLTYTDSWYYYDSCYAIYLRTWVATDDCDNTSYWYQYIYIQDTTPPVIVYDEEIELPCDDFAGIYATVSDNCNEAWIYICDEVYYSGECGGELVRTYCAYDYCGNESYAVQVIHFYDLIAPYVECPEGFTVECGYGYDILYPYFWDNCDYDLSITSGYTVDDSDPCYTYVTYWWTAEDDCYNTTTCSYTVTIVDTTPPMFDYVPSGGEYSCDEEIILVPATAYDWCDEDVTVTSYQNIYPGECEQSYTIETVWVACDDCGNCSYAYTYCYVYDWYAPIWNYVPSDVTIECDDALPTDMATAYDNCDPQVSVGYYDQWYGDSCYGYWFRTFYATDDCGNTGYCYQYIYVLDTTPPVIVYDPEITLPCDNWEGMYATVYDNCNEAWVYVCDEIAYSGDCGGVVQRTYCAYDYCGNESYAVQIIQFYDDVAPYVECPEGFTVECGYDYYTPVPYFWDNCDYDLGITSGSTVDDSDPCHVYVTYWWTATDNCDNSTTCSYTVTIVDTTPPSFWYVPEGGDYSCEETIAYDQAYASDWCDEYVDVTYEDYYSYYCPNTYEITRTWFATDDCGNTSVAYTYFYVYDYTPPTFDYYPSDITVECYDDLGDLPVLTASDNCGEAWVECNVEVIYNDECGNLMWYVVCTAWDECYNYNYTSYYVTVQDYTAPVLYGCPDNLVLECDEQVPAQAVVTALDNCDDDVTVTCTEYCYGECPEPGQTEQGCDLITPILVGSCQNNYDNTNWSMWLGAEADEYKYYDVVPGTGSFDQFGDGTAHLQVTLQSVLGGVHKNGGFVADIWFYNGMDWTNWDNQAFPTGFKADCGGLDAEHVNWTYYLINGDAATLTGWGSFTGSYLTLVHAPINNFFGYQVGLGANNLTANEGHGGWFNYEGWLVDSDSEYAAEIDGGGDFGFEMDCCPDYWLVREYCATDCSGNTTCCSQIITFEGGPTDWVTSPDQPATEQATATKEDFDFVAISPNPTVDRAVIDFTAKVNNTLTMEAYDAAGRKVATLFSGNVEAGQNYRVDFNTQKLEGGIYNIRLFSLSDSRVKKLIVER